MKRRVGVAAALFGVCSHARLEATWSWRQLFGVDHGHQLNAVIDSDAEALDRKVADEDTIAKLKLSPQSNQHIVADLDDIDRMWLVTDTRERSALESNDGVITDDIGSSGTTLSPAARQAAFLKQFEKNFTIQLDMNHAHETGMSLGLELEFEVDYQPAEVGRVRKTGLVEEWNMANPGNELHVGDQIVQVNGIQWHHNTEDFVKRISGQFKAGRKRTPGASEWLTLQVQRPRKAPHAGKKYPLQREDAHHKKYPVEFEATINLPLGGVDMTASEYQVMGWQLYSEHDWDPISIVNLTGEGVIGAYNKANPDHAILAGDELVKVNDVLWHHSADAFRKRVWQKFEVFRKQVAGAETMVLSIRRPAAVHEAALAAKEVVMAKAQEHLDSIQSSVAPEPPVKAFETTLKPYDGAKPAEQKTAASLDERIQAAVSRVKALSANRDIIAREISELRQKSWDLYSELAVAEEVKEELEAERQELGGPEAQQRREAALGAPPPAPRDLAPAAGGGAPAPSLPMERPAGASGGDGASAPPANDGDDDVIGGHEDAVGGGAPAPSLPMESAPGASEATPDETVYEDSAASSNTTSAGPLPIDPDDQVPENSTMQATPGEIVYEDSAASSNTTSAGPLPIDPDDQVPENSTMQDEAEIWTYTPVNGKVIRTREVPEIDGKKTGKQLRPGDTFRVIEKKKVGAVTFLKLAGDEGWLFDSKPDVGLMCTNAKAQILTQQALPMAPPQQALPEDLEAERQGAPLPAPRDLAPAAGSRPPQALPMESPPGASEGDGASAPPASDGGDDDVIGGHEDP